MAKKTAVALSVNAEEFIKRLKAMQSDEELEKIQRYFKTGKDKFIGVRMGSIFDLAKEFIDMPVAEIKKLLQDPIHEVRVGAMSIMDKQGRSKKTTDEQRKALHDLYLAQHAHINNWDLVDLAAGFVLGAYLYDKPREILYKLAKSKDMWKRRSAIVSTSYFLRKRDVDDTFKIAEMLVQDKEDLIQKAYGGWIREAGKQAPKKLFNFLDKHAATMPRTALRYAVERLDKSKKEYYMGLGKVSKGK